MQINYCGTIHFVKKLDDVSVARLKKDVPMSADSYINSECVDIFDCWDVLYDISDWLKAHDNDVENGTVVDYYGDYEGSERYENGEWVGYDSESVCNLADFQLFDELKYRGYDVSAIQNSKTK